MLNFENGTANKQDIKQPRQQISQELLIFV
jgi:hypothetical protein